MKVQYVGKEKEFEVWENQSRRRNVSIKNGDVFSTGKWGSVESVLTDKYEWICDVDSPQFKEEFIVIN